MSHYWLANSNPPWAHLLLSIPIQSVSLWIHHWCEPSRAFWPFAYLFSFEQQTPCLTARTQRISSFWRSQPPPGYFEPLNRPQRGGMVLPLFLSTRLTDGHHVVSSPHKEVWRGFPIYANGAKSLCSRVRSSARASSFVAPVLVAREKRISCKFSGE